MLFSHMNFNSKINIDISNNLNILNDLSANFVKSKKILLDDRTLRKGFFTRLPSDQCDPSGCLTDLCLMMAIYMVFRQVASNFVEFLCKA